MLMKEPQTASIRIRNEFATLLAQTVVKIFGRQVLDQVVSTSFSSGALHIDEHGNVRLSAENAEAQMEKFVAAIRERIAEELGDTFAQQILQNLYQNLKQHYGDTPHLASIAQLLEAHAPVSSAAA